MRLLVALFLTLAATLSHAAVLVVNVYQPLPGKGPLTASYMQEARGILSDMGQRASYTTDLTGGVSFQHVFRRC